MKRLAAVVAGCLLLGSNAVAQTDTLKGVRDGSIELGIAAGVSVPVGDYADWAELSGTGGILVGYYCSQRFSFGADWGGHWHTGTDQADSLLGSEAGFRVYRILTPYAKFQFMVDKVSPYITGLAGLYLQEVKWSEPTVTGTVTNTLAQGYLGVALGGGVQWISDDNAILFLEGKFHTASRSDAPPIQFFDVRAGLAFLL